MDRRIGSILIVVEDKSQVDELNHIISQFSTIIYGRMGIPSHFHSKSIISLVVEGSTDEIGALSGQLGRLKGIQVRSVVIKNKEIE